MKASCIVHTGVNTVALADTSVRAPGPGEVLIETEYSLISPGTELRCLAGLEPGQSPFPFIPGYALAGKIIEAGAGAPLKPGTRVMTSSTQHAEGIARQWGGHISHAVTPASSVIPIPDNVPTLAGLIGRLAAIPYHGLRLARPTAGERVAVLGLGVIGLSAAKLYAIHGTQVVAIDRSPARVERAAKWDLTAEASSASAAETIRKRFPQGVDILVDATGVPAVVGDAIQSMRDLGWNDAEATPARYVIQGSYSASVTIPYRPAFWAEVTVLFPRAAQQRDMLAVTELAADGKIDLSPLVDDIRSPADAPAAYAALADSRTAPLTVAFKWTK